MLPPVPSAALCPAARAKRSAHSSALSPTQVNGFTGERTTTFYGSLEIGRNVRRSKTAAAAESSAQQSACDDVREGCRRFGALFSRAPLALPVVKQEVGRVDDELRETAKSPSRALVELGALKARASASSPWRRLGRGDRATLRAEEGDNYASEARLAELAQRVGIFRAARYRPGTTTVAVVSPLPLNEACDIVGSALAASAFADGEVTGAPVLPPPFPAVVRSVEAWKRAGETLTVSEAELEASRPFADFGRVRGGAFALEWKRRRALLCLAWTAELGPEAVRQKPLALLGHALCSPHPNSLAKALRSRGLSPLEIEVEPVVFSRTIARADGWAIWQLEITLAEGAEGRWREAAALGVAAVERLAARRLPPATAAEAAALSEAAWRWSSRAPTAVELAYDLQNEPAPELAVEGARSFVGEPSVLAASVDAVAAQLARSSPVVTLWASDLAPLGVDPLASTPPLPAPLGETGGGAIARLTPLKLGAELLGAKLRAEELTPPPPNKWVPSRFAPNPGPQMEQRSYRFRTPGARGGGIQGSDGAGAESGVRVVQLPGCVAMGKLAVAGSKKALAEVECVATGDYRGGYGQRPFASAVLQVRRARATRSELRLPAPTPQPEPEPESLSARSGRWLPLPALFLTRPLLSTPLQVESSRPAAAGPRQQARGELWRLTLLQALAPTAAAAAAAGLKLDVSYNGRGLRLVVSGYAQKLPQFLLFALRRYAASHRTVDPVAGRPAGPAGLFAGWLTGWLTATL